MMQPNIRPATSDDIASVVRLLIAGAEFHARALPSLLRPLEAAATEEFVRDILRDDDAHLLLAEVDAQAVGLVHFTLVADGGNPARVGRTFVSVSILVVQAREQRQGIGKALMLAVHAWAVERRIAEIELTVYEFNTPARMFYERLGYETSSRRMTRSAHLTP